MTVLPTFGDKRYKNGGRSHMVIAETDAILLYMPFAVWKNKGFPY
jgi:hypothetical protein